MKKRQKPEELFNKALSAYKHGELRTAERLLEQLIQQQVKHADIYNLAGIIAVKHEHYRKGEEYLKKSLELNPKNDNALNNLGLCLYKQSLYQETIPIFKQAININPNNYEAWNNLGTVYSDLFDSKSAIECFQTALNLNPTRKGTHRNLAVMYSQEQQWQLALDYFNQATELNPHDYDSHYNKCLAYWNLGKMEQGFNAYRYRYKAKDQANNLINRNIPYPNWDGSSLAGKRVLLYAEQGLGDEFFWARFIPCSIKEAASITVECDYRIVSLFQASYPNINVIPREINRDWAQAGQFDLKIPFPDLGLRYGLLLKDAKYVEKPFLKPDKSLKELWRNKLRSTADYKYVGVCWRSSLLTKQRAHLYMSAHEIADCFKGITQVRVVNLQYDSNDKELQILQSSLGNRFTHFSDIDLKNDQAQLSALISNLDLVITAGTAINTLSVALGTPCWLFSYESFERLNFIPYCEQKKKIFKKNTPSWQAVINSINLYLSKTL